MRTQAVDRIAHRSVGHRRERQPWRTRRRVRVL